ncbi:MULTISPECIES: transcriptional regulator Spx [Lactococcus]|uniref:Transcriptional regulator Spx n=2 Tax=Lactococcus TaxID=1357 RepID=A0ABV4D8J7_9LACT|nr:MULTISPECIES: transcriptional regulator Spx [Lactococcus]MBL3716397.1 Spx/MgsR family RNA polymerase-binding regulatory protein [Lactococcus garvieae]
MIKFYYTPSCTSCRKAKVWLEKHNLAYTEHNLFAQPLTDEEIADLLSKTENGTEDLITTRSQAFKSLKVNVDEMTVKEWTKFISQHPELLRRPLLVKGEKLQAGFNEEQLRSFFSREYRQIELQETKKAVA